MNLTESLFRLRRRQCEERRAYLAELDLLARRLREDASLLQAGIGRTGAAGDPARAQELAERLGKLEGSISTVNHQIAAASDALAAAEGELQRHELASTRRAGDAGERRARRSPATPPVPSPIARSDRGG